MNSAIRRLWTSLIALSVVLSANSALSAEKTTKNKMRRIYKDLEAVFPLAVQEGQFANKKNKARIEQGLRNLEKDVADLNRHGTKKRDVAFVFLSYSLEETAAQARQAFQKGHYDEAGQLIRNLTDYCISCHSMQAGDKSSGFSAGFTKIEGTSKLSLMQKVRLQIATRQFVAAMDSWEALLDDPHYGTPMMIPGDPFLDYLIVTLRVRKEPARALKSVQRLLKKPEIPGYLRESLQSWEVALKKIIADPTLRKANLPTARRAMDAGRRIMETPFDRAGLIWYLHGSGLLMEYIQTRPKDRDKVAEAWYLLAMTELMTGRSLWLSKAMNYLETTIMVAPNSRWGKKALNMMEEHLVIYFHSMDRNDEESKRFNRRLKRLRDLVAS